MTLARSLLFALIFYAWSVAIALLGLPLIWLAPRSWLVGWMKFWATSSTWAYRVPIRMSASTRPVSARRFTPTPATWLGSSACKKPSAEAIRYS